MSLKLKEDIIIDGTSHMLEITAEITSIKLDGHLFTATVDEPKEEITQSPNNIEKQKNSIPLAEFVKGQRSPNSTALFLNWLSQKHIKEFDINDFLNDHLSISKEQAETIIIYQIGKKKLIQLSNTKFRVVEE